MADLFDKQAEVYAEARPTYPKEWYEKFASLTLHHALAWDVGTGNGQAALGVAEHFKKVIATDVSQKQLNYTTPHPRIHYYHTPLSTTDEEIISLVGGENHVDLITVAQAVHWFDLPPFYFLATRLLRKPGGIIAVWGYGTMQVSPSFDTVLKRFLETTLPYWNPNIKYVFDNYKTLPFPFEGVGLGCEGNPIELDIRKEISLDGVLGILRSWSGVATANERGVNLLSERVLSELESAWGGSLKLIRPVVYKAFMLVGKVKI